LIDARSRGSTIPSSEFIRGRKGKLASSEGASALIGAHQGINRAVEPLCVHMYNVHMHDLRFEWDEAKNRQNVKKHGVSFEEAQTVFFDDHAMRFFDPDHSRDEDRFVMLGISFKLRVLVVCHCYQESDSVIRIISARKATQQEAKHYGR
jgi:hypothetical protein